ncbi:MAG: hypothetical protein ACTSRT_21390 [Promethearchaeota archaeon]
MDELSGEIQALKGFFFEENDFTGEVRSTKQGKLYFENIIIP